MDHRLLEVFEGLEWLTMEESIDRLAALDYWPSDVTAAEQVAHIETHMTRFVDDDGLPRIARLWVEHDGICQWVYKATQAFTAADATFLYRAMQATDPCAIVHDAHIRECLQAHPHWEDRGVRLFHQHAADPYPLALLSRPAARALLSWEVRRRSLTRAEARAVARRLGFE
jgi:hypothetical protein